LLLATVVAAFGVRFFVTQRINAQQEENQQLETALKALRRETAEVDTLHDLIADFLLRTQIAKAVREDSSPAAEAFAELSRLPNDIVLTRAQAKGMQLVASGVARSETAARKMVEQLNAMRFITNPRIAKIDPAPAHDPFGAEARVFQLEADLRH
jgi:Tfp pilus assembly protein PilN